MSDKTESYPLVSVVVVTYNSAQYVRQTLESVLSQTYKGPIELIVSDDGSKDETVAICERWMDEHSSSLHNCAVIQTPHNLGICGNYNFALGHIAGEWVKYIAGDDLLTHECIETYINAALKSDDKFFISGVLTFYNGQDSFTPRYLMGELLDSSDASVQAQNLAKFAGGGIVEGPTFFINTKSFREMGGMNTYYPMLEDFPFAFRWAFSGRHIGVIKKPLVKYRIYPESISQSKEMFKVMYHDAMYDARMKIAKRQHNYFEWWHNRVMKRLSGYESIKDDKGFPHYMWKLSDIYAHSKRIQNIFKFNVYKR